MFKVENGMVLIMVGEVLGGVDGEELREIRTKISDPSMKRNVRLADAMRKYIITWDFGLSTPISNAKNGAFPGTQGHTFVC